MEFVRYEKHNDQVVIITLNRPERLNAWGTQLNRETEEAFCQYADDDQARVAILTGAGRAFCAGVDIKEWAERGRSASRQEYRRVFTSEWGTPALMKPIIAAVHGYCIGAGVNIVLMRCDIRICGESTRFAMPEVARGIMDLTTSFFYNNIPTCFLSELFYTCDYVSAERAHHFGMVNMVVPDDQVMPTALSMAERIAQHAPRAIRQTKENLMRTMEASRAAFAWENYLRSQSFDTSDAIEGMRAFAEKRQPRWTER